MNMKLPLGVHLFDSVWAVATRKELQFSIVCQIADRETRTIIPPVSLLQIPTSCIASNLYMSLSSSYEARSAFDLPDNNLDLLRHINISQIKMWLPFVESLPNTTKLTLSKTLKEIPRIPLHNLIDELQSVQKVDIEPSGWPLWAYICIA